MSLKPPKDGNELLDMYYLDMRSHLLEVAAAFDRIEAAGGADNDPRLKRLREIGAIAIGEDRERAKRFLEHLSC